METASTQPSSLNLDLASIFRASCLPVSSPYILDMYTTQHLEVPKVSMGRMYSASHVLTKEDSMTTMNLPPKKENILQTMFNTVANMIGEQLSRVPATIMSNMNSPLSVTVVPNESIISHEFFKTLTHRKDLLVSDNPYVNNDMRKESLNIVEKVQDTILDEKSFHIVDPFEIVAYESVKSSIDHVDSQTRGIDETDYCNVMTPTKGGYADFIELDTACTKSQIIENDSHPPNGANKTAEIATDNRTQATNTDHCKKGNRSSPTRDSEIVVVDFDQVDLKSHNTTPSTSTLGSKVSHESSPEPTLSCLFTNIWRRVVHGVTDRLASKLETDMEPPAKRANSPKQGKKLSIVANGRGRGRARSQLRRSGVSQTRHRKERTKHDLLVDMHDDFETWQDFDVYRTVQSNSPLSSFILSENDLGARNSTDFIVQKTASPVPFTLNDVKPRKRKPKTRKVVELEVSKFPTRVRYVPECAMDCSPCYRDYNDKKCDLTKDAFRPRLVSESSVDSEDSYCIVFETGSEQSCDSDVDYSETSSEDENNTDECEHSMQKVKFNLKPIIHTMVQWDYAYRTARRGPWEEMARDRDRFRSRINCIGRILDPILSNQHRTHVWQERFALVE